MANLNEYLTISEAAELLSVGQDVSRYRDRSGTLKARRSPLPMLPVPRRISPRLPSTSEE